MTAEDRRGPWSDKSIVITEQSVLDDLKTRLAESQAREREWELVLIQYWDQTSPSPSAPEQVLGEIRKTEQELAEWKESSDACSMELQRARKERDAGWAERDVLKVSQAKWLRELAEIVGPRDAGYADIWSSVELLVNERDALRAEHRALFKIHREDETPCYHDQASGPSCANEAHYRPPTYEDWLRQGSAGAIP